MNQSKPSLITTVKTVVSIAIGAIALIPAIHLNAASIDATSQPADNDAYFIEITQSTREDVTFGVRMTGLLNQLSALGATTDEFLVGVPHLYVRTYLPAASVLQRGQQIATIQSLALVQSVIAATSANVCIQNSDQLTVYPSLNKIDPLDLAGFQRKRTAYVPDLRAAQTGEVIVKYMQDQVHASSTFQSVRSTMAALHNSIGASVKNVYKKGDNYWEVLTIPSALDLGVVLQRYLASPSVEYAQPNFIYYSQSAVGTPNASFLTGNSGWAFGQISMPAAWQIAQTSWSQTPVIVAVVDSGISLVNNTYYTVNGLQDILNYSVTPHPDLASNMWNNPDTGSTLTFNEGYGQSIANDGKYGFNTAYYTGGTSQTGGDPTYSINVNSFGYIAPAYPYGGVSTPDDDVLIGRIDSGAYFEFGHGTQVAGVIGAVGNNSVGPAAGVAYSGSVRLMAVKALAEGSFLVTAQGTSESIYAGLEYAIGYVGRAEGPIVNYNSAKIINLANDTWPVSSGSYDPVVQAALSDVYTTGAVLVNSAGNGNQNNDSTPVYPANYNLPNMVVVGGSDSSDNVADFNYTISTSGNVNVEQKSNWGQYSVDVFAPGVNVWTTDTSNRYNINMAYPNAPAVLGDGYVRAAPGASGTSIASGLVSGMLALASEEFPWESGSDLADRARFSVDHPLNSGGTALLGLDCLSGGRINVANALSPRPTLINLSARAWVGTGLNVSVVGFYITGSSGDGSHNKMVAFQGLGPGLAVQGISGSLLANAQLTLWNSAGQVLAVSVGGNLTLTSYGAGLTVGSVPSYAGPLATGDTAFAVSLPPGGYTVSLQDANGATGQGLNGVYDLDNDQEASNLTRFTNLSARFYVGNIPGGGASYPGYAGYWVSGNGGPNQRGVILETQGPSLAAEFGGAFNSSTVLSNPTFNISGTSAISMGWGSSNSWGLASTPAALTNRLNQAGSGIGGTYVDCDLPYTFQGPMTVTLNGPGGSAPGGVVVLSGYEL